MIDQAGIMMAQGRSIASERIQGVNDNMSKSHYHDYLNYIIWRKGNGTTLSRTVSTASIRENSSYFPPT